MEWVRQHKNYGLGNFINITGGIRAIYDQSGPVDTYFEVEYVKNCYKESKYITIIEEMPENEPILCSSMVNLEVQDCFYSYNILKKGGDYPEVMPPLFIDSPQIEHNYNDFVVIINGSGNRKSPVYSQKKLIKPEILQKIADLTRHRVIFIGSEEDYIQLSGVSYELGDIRKCLALIRDCEYVISNDSGLYHAAGCFNKKGFIMWKDTNFKKNQSPNLNFVYSFGDYVEDYKMWV